MKMDRKDVRHQRPVRGFWSWLFGGAGASGVGGKA